MAKPGWKVPSALLYGSQDFLPVPETSHHAESGLAPDDSEDSVNRVS